MYCVLYLSDDYWSPWYDQGPPDGGKEEEKRVQLSTVREL